MSLIKSFVFFLSITLVSLSAQSVEISENVISCTMLDGNLTHKVVKSSSGDFSAYISFPPYYQELSDEVLEEKKKEWANWDGVSAPPSDPRKIAFGVPLESSNVVSFDLKRLEKKAMFFNKLFPPLEKGVEGAASSFGKLLLDFSKEQCAVVGKDSLMSVYCENNNGITLNGVRVEGVSLRMTSRKTTEMVFIDGGSAGVLEMKNFVSADLILFSQNTYYRSSFTYEPNGNDKQCWLNNEKLSTVIAGN